MKGVIGYKQNGSIQSPIVECCVSDNGYQVEVFCPYCSCWHFHGFTKDDLPYGELSPKISPCFELKSPFYSKTYFLKLSLNKHKKLSDNIYELMDIIEGIQEKPQGINPLYFIKSYLNKKPMIYFLCNGNKIYYIGETFRPIQRMKIHYKEKEYFDTVFYKEIRLDCLNLVEKVLISEIKPIMNNHYTK